MTINRTHIFSCSWDPISDGEMWRKLEIEHYRKSKKVQIDTINEKI